MKVKKLVLFIVTIAIMLFLNSSDVYANMAPLSIKYALPAAIMRLSVFVILFIYIISCIIYLAKSKKSKTEKFKRLTIWLVIVAIVCLILWYGAGFILKNARRW